MKKSVLGLVLSAILGTAGAAFCGEARWIWYPGDYGIWWGNRLQSERLQWGSRLTPFWPMYEPHSRVLFRRDVKLADDEPLEIRCDGNAAVCWWDGTGNYTENTALPEEKKRDLIVSLVTLKYTQSNSVVFAFDGQAIGVGAGQQSRIHCTRLAGDKADHWLLRQTEQVLNLPFKDSVGRPERDNAIDIYLSEDYEDVIGDGKWEALFTEQPAPFLRKDQRAYLATVTGVSIGSDAFFPFSDNIERAFKSGVSYVAQPGGSVRDDLVIKACDDMGMVMAFTGLRLFHH